MELKSGLSCRVIWSLPSTPPPPLVSVSLCVLWESIPTYFTCCKAKESNVCKVFHTLAFVLTWEKDGDLRARSEASVVESNLPCCSLRGPTGVVA